MSQGYARNHQVELVDGYGFEVENTPIGEQRVVIPFRLIGANFEGSTIDTNFWTSTVANAATNTQANGVVTMASGVNAAGSAQFNSNRRARYVGGSSNNFRAVIQLGDTGIANNTRRWGLAFGATMPTITDGAYFRLSGTTFSVVTLKGSSATAVDSGSFNGDLGASYALDTNAHTYEIYYTNSSVYFVIDDKILHKVSATSATWSNTTSHYVYLSNINSGNTTDVSLMCRVVTIRRLGSFETQPISYFQIGTTAGVVLKYSPGNFHGLVISNVTNNSNVTLYDNTAASGTVLFSTGAMGALTTPFDLEFHSIPFSNGLTLVISGAASNATVIYE